VLVVYLKADYDSIQGRMTAHSGHYMKPGMLKSLYDALEEPTYGLVVDASLPVDEIMRRTLECTK